MKKKSKLRSLIAGLATSAVLLAPAVPKADQYKQIDLARDTNGINSVRVGAGTTELPFGTEAYTLMDIIPGEETAHMSETTAITPLVKGVGPVVDAVLSSDGDYLSAGIGYSGEFPLGVYGTAFYLPVTTGDGSTFGIAGVRPINDNLSLEGFYFRQFLDGDDYTWAEVQGNYSITENLDAILTGVHTSDGNSVRAGVRLK